MDALHVASALAAGATWLLTTDTGLLGKMQGDTRIQVADTVEAERFIALINRERFDYTEWRRGQWQDETVATLAGNARLQRAARKA